MSVKLPELAKMDYTSLDFQSIINLVQKLISDHPDYFVGIDDFTQSNAGRMTIELVAYIVDLLAERIDWVANEGTLPTSTQKQRVMDLMKLINYRFKLPTSASVTVSAIISKWVNPFVLPSRYSIPAKDLNGNTISFELLSKDSEGRYVYEDIGSGYEFDTGYATAPLLRKNDLVFYEGHSHREFSTMTGINNEIVMLSRTNVEEGSIRAWKVTRNNNGDIISKRELTIVNSFISPEAQAASASGLPPCKIMPTENNGVYLSFGESPVVATFSPSGTDEVMVWYRTTNGANGNITKNAINYTTTLSIAGQTIQINFVNSIAASGGSDSETIEHAKRYGPLSLTTAQKTVNPEDFIILLQEFNSIINSITYGKSNEPEDIKKEYGYHIPPYEAWIYPLFNKPGWESFPTYAYQKLLKVGRPYNTYGLTDVEVVKFEGETSVFLKKIKENSFYNDYSNIVVSDFYNKVQYVPGSDFVINLESRELIRLENGSIGTNTIVTVQYYENSEIESATIIDFSTGDIQDIPKKPIYPGLRTWAISYDLQNKFVENDVSENDYNYPNNDYHIDYQNGKIIRHSAYPILESKASFVNGTEFLNGVNNEFIVKFNGLNKTAYNSEIDFKIDCFNGWARLGDGTITPLSAGTYYFKVSIDGSEFIEYKVTLAGPSYTARELVAALNTAVRVSDNITSIKSAPLYIFADYYHFPDSPILTFMSKNSGPNSSVQISGGTSGTSLLAYNLTNVVTGSGETFTIYELTKRLRATLNSLGLCNGFVGQSLAVNNEEEPEIMSKSDLLSPATFAIPAAARLRFKLTGTALGTYDIEKDVILTTTAGKTYNLTEVQGRLDLISNLQADLNNAYAQDVVEAFWVRTPEGFYRIGFRLLDTKGTTSPSITIKDASSNSIRYLFQFSNDQSSTDSNLVDARISPKSTMINSFLFRIELFGAFGDNAYIQSKSSKALHNNTLALLQLGNMQFSKGSKILSRTMIGQHPLISDGSLLYTFNANGVNQNNQFILNISGAPTGDDDYTITIPAGTYNINQLVNVLNTAIKTADKSGQSIDLSTFLIFEKVEGFQKIRIKMTNFTGTSPDLYFSSSPDKPIATKCADKLGFELNKKMSDYSKIILHYAGDWISDKTADQSEENAVIKYLKSSRLICQDYIIKDPKVTSFDIKGTVYCSKGFDRSIIRENAINNIRNSFKLSKREFAEDVAISNITKEIEKVEGTVHTVIDYFGKDYQLYKQHSAAKKRAEITGKVPADIILSRWSNKSAFKIILDGCTLNNVNYDGEYLIIVGNSWSDRSYDSLIDAINLGSGVSGGLAHAIPLALGKSEVNLTPVIKATVSSGFVTLYSIPEGSTVMIKVEEPDNIQTYGSQTFRRSSDILETQYAKSFNYNFKININGSGVTNYTITSPTSGDWPLYDVAERLEAILPNSVSVGIDDNGRIRITSLLGGNQSTIAIGNGDTNDFVTLMGGIESAVNGTSGYVSCLSGGSGTLNIDAQTVYGKSQEPEKEEDSAAYNYRTIIPAGYCELLYISDDYYAGDIHDIDHQLHGIILNFVELGRENG